MTRRILLVLTIATVVIAGLRLAAAPQANANGDKLLAAAKHKATDDGDVPASIEMYKQIAANAGGDRVLAARALLGMAEGYETLGTPEARTTYEMILREYPNSAVANVARSKIAALAQQGVGVAARLLVDDLDTDAVSPDGSYVTFVTDHDDIGVRDLKSGGIQQLTSKAPTDDSAAGSPSPSPDSRLIAYRWQGPDPRVTEVRVISRDGGPARKVYGGDRLVIGVVGWSRDGQGIFAYLRKGQPSERSFDLVMIPADGGPPRQVRSLDVTSAFYGKQAVSPDGRFLVGTVPTAAGKPERDVIVLSLETGRLETIVKHPADDYPLAWYSDGTGILFASDRGGDYGIWMNRVVDGHPEGTPVPIQASGAAPLSLGFTRNGDFFYSRFVRTYSVLTATIATERENANQKLLEGRYTGGMLTPAWSPDGQRLAYVQETKIGPGPIQAFGTQVRKLAIYTIATGDTRLLTLPVGDILNPTWSRDGRTITVEGDLLNALFSVDVASGAVATVLDSKPAESSLSRPNLSRDGNYLFGYRSTPGSPKRLIRRDLKSGTETSITIEPTSFFVQSPDGQWLALKGVTPQTMWVIAASGGSPTRLAAVADWPLTPFFAWTADNRSVLVVKRLRDTFEIWLVPTDGSTPRFTGTSTTQPITHISAHPDGRQLAISQVGEKYQTWVLSNIPGPGAK